LKLLVWLLWPLLLLGRRPRPLLHHIHIRILLSRNAIAAVRARNDFLVPLRAPNAARAARDEDDEKEKPNACCNPNDDGLVVINPASDLPARCSAFAVAVVAFSITSARRPVEQILL